MFKQVVRWKTYNGVGTTHNTKWKAHTFHPRIINLTNINSTKEQINTIALGTNYATEKDPKHYINELIIDTENAIRHLKPKMQNTFQYLDTKKIKQIMTTTTCNTLHKRYHNNINQIKKHHSTKQFNNNKSRQKQNYSHHQQKHTKTKSGQLHTTESHIKLK